MENWKLIEGYADYEVSDLGRVRRADSGKIRKAQKHDGYAGIILFIDGKPKNKLVHRLVYEAFHGPIPDGYEIDHINGVKDDNRLSNLRCVTPKENTNNPVTRKRQLDGIAVRENDKDWNAKRREGAKKRKENQEWRNNMREGVRRVCAKPVLQLDKKTGEVIRKWNSIADIRRMLGISSGNISACCRGERKHASGFRWEFA